MSFDTKRIKFIGKKIAALILNMNNTPLEALEKFVD